MASREEQIELTKGLRSSPTYTRYRREGPRISAITEMPYFEAIAVQNQLFSILDRIIHNVHRLELSGDSVRCQNRRSLTECNRL
jgi:hypothetical protein